MESNNNCDKHNKQYTIMCLAQDCKEDFFLCPECKLTNLHKHSKTDLVAIKEIREKLKNSWEPKDSTIQPYFKQVTLFYENLRKDINKLIDEDQKAVQTFLTKVKYYHLPVEANSQVYLEFIKEEYERLDRFSMLKLINEMENGEMNKNLDKQKQIAKFLQNQLKRVQDKVMTLKYVMLSKKLQSELLTPKLPQPSKICDQQQFTKIYSLFNSRKLLVRSIRMVYRGSDSKFSPKDFYNRCNGVSNCLALVKTKNKRIVGGYCPSPFVHTDQDSFEEGKTEYESDNSGRSFIFILNTVRTYSLKDKQKALLYKKGSIGPSFGGDLQIGKMVTSSMGNSYEGAEGIAVDSLESKVFLLETDKAELEEMEIWQMSF